MRITEFSPKQRLVMKWWNMRRYSRYDAVICDGAVRSGKTLSMSLGFIFWAVSTFEGCSFAMCGKTVTSLRRNVITPLLPLLADYGFTVSEKVSRNCFDITLLGRTNVPVRQLLEQLIAKLSIPPFLLGLSWSSTERMSSQQLRQLRPQ